MTLFLVRHVRSLVDATRPKAQQTSHLLTDGQVGVVEEPRGHRAGGRLARDLGERVLAALRWASLGMPDVIEVPAVLR